MSDKYPGGFVTAGAPAGFSVAFDGTGDYLSTPLGTALSLSSGDFCVEAWVYKTAASGNDWKLVASNNGAACFLGDGGTTSSRGLGWGDSGGWAFVSGVVLPINEWSHVCFTRLSGVGRIFLNGYMRGYTASNATILNLSTAGAPMWIANDPFGYTLQGYISNLRIIKAAVPTAYQTAATTTSTTTRIFVPPTQLFPIANTQLLACQSPTIVDNSSNNLTLTANGNAAVSNFTPFAGYQGFNPALGAAAGGVWTLDEAAYYQNNRQWPIYDPYFNQTTLMLHGNGTNAAQNNTFLDSSTNNFTITRNGNTTQGTFSPFSQTGWALNITAGSDNNDYISTPTSANLRLDQGNFTLEFWLFISAFGAANNRIFDTGGNGDAAATVIGYGSNGGIGWGRPTAGTGMDAPAGTITTNRWYHVVATSSGAGTNGALYVNGVRVAFTASYTNPTGTSSPFNIGRNNVNAADWAGLVGYISNFRFVSGQQLYTANFTPDVRPLTTNTYTTDGGVTYKQITGACQLLTCQDNRFVDDSANNFAITVNGTNPSIQAFSPFAPSVTTPVTYSNWFNGSTGYLSVADNAAFAFGANPFTIEAWFYPRLGSTSQYVLSQNPNTVTNASFAWLFTTSNTLQASAMSGSTEYIVTSPALTLNTWYHVAFVRSGINLSLFINGTRAATIATLSTNSLNDSTAQVRIGALDNATPFVFSGSISNVRIVKGTAVYDPTQSTLTVPTAPLTNISGTSLLTCQSSTLIDNSTANGGVGFTITQNGVVQPVTSPTPFAPLVDQTTLNTAYSTSLVGGSAYFDGTGDYLAGTGNVINSNIAFTIEAWVYLTGATTNQSIFSTSSTTGGTSGANLWINGSSFPTLSRGNGGAGTDVVGSTAVKANTWNNIVACRTSGGAITVFLNGVSIGSGTDASATNTTAFVIGSNYINGAINVTQGYIGSVRVTTGAALYSSNFTPSSAPFTTTVSSGTVSLLCNFTNAGIIDNTAKNVLETVGNAQISTTQSKWGGSSMFFDGTGDYLQMRPVYLQTLPGAFTIESWIYPINTAQFRLWGNWNSNSNGYAVFISPTGSYIRMYYGNYGSNEGWLQANVTIPTSTWSHVAVCRDASNNWYFFLNGILITNTGTGGSTWTNSRDFNNVSDPLFIGESSYNGYIDDFRLTKNVARYTTTFTSPTSQLQDQ